MKKFKLICIILSVVMLVSFITACSKNNKKDSSSTSDSSENKNQKIEMLQFEEPTKDTPIATIKVKDFGEIKIMLFKKQAPKSVENFVKHSKDGYYNNTTLHRIMKDFMIQGGDPEGTGMGGESIWGKSFEIETNPSLRHYRGALSMANTGQPNSNGSQFFIVQQSKVADGLIKQMSEADWPEKVIEKYKEIGGVPQLDGGYTVFGQVIEGMEVVDKIADVKVTANSGGEKSVPVENVIIETITIQE